MTRAAALIVALALLLMQSAMASRVCACVEAMKAAACCDAGASCCAGGECAAHDEPAPANDLAFDVCRAVDALQAIPLVEIIQKYQVVDAAPCHAAPIIVRVRGPDLRLAPLRAPPLQA